MPEPSLRRIHARVVEIERALGELKRELAALSDEGSAAEPVAPPAGAGRRGTRRRAPEVGEMRSEYRILYERFVREGPMVIDAFVREKSDEFLVLFCRANRLPSVGPDTERPRVALRLAQQMAARRAVERRND